MKKLNLALIGVALMLSTAFESCKKDEQTIKTNSFSYDSKNYETPKGFLDFYGAEADNKSSSIDLALLSSGISVDMADTNVVGKGEYVYVELQSPSLTELVSGTYTFDPNANYGVDGSPLKPNTFGDAGIGINYDFANDSVNEYYVGSTSTGSVIINKSGTTYEITFNFTLDGGKKVEGYYKGTLQFIDETGIKKSAQVTNHKRMRIIK